jgi:polysaccharide pyruvyl transferase WcaK-like protein
MYGAPNFGDELLLLSNINYLNRVYNSPIINVITFSAHGSRRYLDIPVNYSEGYWPTPKFFLKFHSIVKVLYQSDLLIIGGGGLISDTHSPWSTLGYFLNAVIAMLLNRPFILVGIGALQLHRKLLKMFLRVILPHSRGIYCRDRFSKEIVASLCGAMDIVVGPDLSFLYRKRKITAPHGAYGLLNLRQKPRKDTMPIVDVINTITRQGWKLLLFCAEAADKQYYDGLISNEAVENKKEISVFVPNNLLEGIEVIGSSNFVIAERLHVNAVSYFYKVPTLTVAYENKVSDFVSSFVPIPAIIKSRELDGKTVTTFLSKLSDIEDKIVDTKLLRKRVEYTLRLVLQSAESAIPMYSLKTRGIVSILLIVILSIGVVRGFFKLPPYLVVLTFSSLRKVRQALL